MENIRLVKTSLKIVFEEGDSDNSEFNKEYYSLIQLNDDPLGAWLRSSKMRKEADETNQVLLTLLIELHRKVDNLAHTMKTDAPLVLPLKNQENLITIGHGYFQFEHNVLEVGQKYYGRIDVPTFPRREMPIFFEAATENIAKIILMHEDDEKDWSTYMMACERVIIRQMKGRENEY